MPIYEYRCAGCGHKFEELVLSKSEKISCPKCGGKKTEKLFSSFFAKSSGSSSPSSAKNCHNCSSSNCSACH